MGRKKRHRGGQPGNQNARKHGFYAGVMTNQEIAEFCKAMDTGGKDHALIALQLKIKNALASAPDNYRVLREGANSLSQYVAASHDLNEEEFAFFKQASRAIFKAAVIGDINLTNRIGSEIVKAAEKLQNQ